MGLLGSAESNPRVGDESESDLARRLREGGFLAFTRSTRIVLKDGERETWIQISRLGEWKGHVAGEFSLTAEHHASAIAQFEATENDLVLDYEHQSASFIPVEAPAAGWISDLRDDAGALMARVRFTDRAAERIRADEYRYTSPVWLFDVPDRVSGEPVLAELHSVALTNVPFLDGMKPISLTRGKAMTTKVRKNATPAGEQALAELQRILGLASEEELAAWVAQNASSLESMASGEGEAEMTKELAETKAELARTTKDLETKTKALSIAIDEKDRLATQVTTLRNAEGARLVEAAIKEGRMAASQRDAMLPMARTAPKEKPEDADGPHELFLSLTKTAIATPITTPVTRPNGGGVGDDDLSPREEKFYRALKQSKPRRAGKLLTDKEIRELARERAQA